MVVKNVIDLFCGAGGMSAGFRKAGFRILLGIDINPAYLATFATNHPEAKAVCEDIVGVSGTEIKKLLGEKKVHVVIGGPPCQGFSIARARKRNPKDPRNNMPQEFLRIVAKIRPEWFVCENVVGILSAKLSDGTLVKDKFINTARKIGYKSEYRVLDASNFGVPQARRRVVFIGTRLNKPIIFPSGNNIRAVISSKILLKKQLIDQKYFFSRKLIKGFRRREKENRKRGLGFRWQFIKVGSPSYTIPARYYKDGANALVRYNDKSIRRLTEIECARIQGFPKDYIFLGSKRGVYQKIGNAVPPPLAAAIAKNLYATPRNATNASKSLQALRVSG
ncbi:MAG: DNA cytosine methyltransferase [Candidatus Liptonbacteria bacterium]|nr:DNA cytosine methyltransferase [Candidatus Liptonbacteria bacterium]